MSELVEFIRGCLDADEQTARAATPGPFRIGSDYVGKRYIETHDGDLIAGNVSWEDAPFIARHDPARVLAEVNAKRAILDKYEAHRKRAKKAWKEYSRWIEGKPTPQPGTPMYESDTDVTETYERVLLLLAQCFRGEPGWRDEWGTQ